MQDNKIIFLEGSMNSTEVEKLLADEYARVGQTTFVLTVTPLIDYRSVLTLLRHFKAQGKIGGYNIVGEETGTVRVLDYVP
jgi:hypothetical protein